MKQKFRLLKTGYNTAFMNMAIDESILRNKVMPTIRFYGWKPSAVSIGYFQSLKEEVDLDKCKEYNVDFIRRVTGGGAVFHDKELTYSFIAPEELVSKDILESYKGICNGIIKGLKALGINSGFAGLNDIVADGKKISGNAQTRKQGMVLQHGTILMELDVEKMFSLLKVPSEKIRDKLIENVKERVTSLKIILGKEIGFEELSNKIADGFREALNLELVEEELTEEELELAKELEREKYNTKEWNFKR